jgi:uncharacterized protein (DUF1015 family)
LADVRPFRGVTYDPARVDLARVLCAPYDVINPRQQAGYYERDEHNAVRIVLNRGEGEARYSDAAETLDRWLGDGTLRAAARPAFHVHRHGFQTVTGRVERLGILAAVRVEPWESQAVLPHEHTMPGPKEDRLALLRATNADTEPIWVFHPDPGSQVRSLLERLIVAEPSLRAEFTPEPIAGEEVAPETHELWQIDDESEVAIIREVLSGTHLYIADGHHRYETALLHAQEAGGGVDDAARFKVMLLSSMRDEGLIVMPTHRMLRLPPGQPLGRMLSQLRLWGWRTEQPSELGQLLARLREPPDLAHIGFGMFTDGRYSYLEGIVANPAVELLPAAIRDLDAALIQHGILSPLLGIDDERLAAGEGIAYSRDPGEVRDRVVSGEYDVGLFLRPPTLTQVKRVADQGQSMPPKSTFFWPKPPSGLIMALQRPGQPL